MNSVHMVEHRLTRRILIALLHAPSNSPTITLARCPAFPLDTTSWLEHGIFCGSHGGQLKFGKRPLQLRFVVLES